MEKRVFLKRSLAVAGAAAAGSLGRPARASEPVKLRISHFMSPMAPAQTMLFKPWAERVERDSDGRIKCEVYPSMQLGGKPAQLYDQVRTGVADIAWIVPGYNPGRFPKTAVFDLPFAVGTSAESTAQAIWAFYKKNLTDEFADIHPLLLHCHAPGVLHMKEPDIERMEDLRGRKIRLPTKPVGDALRMMGAIPVGMPVSEAYEAISRGVADGLSLAWEGMKPMRLNELVRTHTAAELYTVVFLVAMNRKKYESLPPDLKEVIDHHSGDHFIREIGRAWDLAELPGIAQAEEMGHRIIRLDPDEKRRWQKTTQPVIDAWIAATPDGRRLYEEAMALIAQYERAV